MPKKILLPTDFSKRSWNSIQYAIKLYEQQRCDFYLLNTYSKDTVDLDSHILLDPDEAFNKFSERQSQKGLGNTLVRIAEIDNNKDHRFYAISRSENFLDTVKDVVQSLQIDMIIMGAKGMTNEWERKYGKNTLRVIENIRKCPVLVVPKDVIFDHPKEIVLVTNFDKDYNETEIKYLVEIARMSKANVQVLSLEDNKNLSSRQKKNKLLLEKHLKGIDHTFNVLHNVKMADAISCFVEIRRSNMISYIDKKPSFWETLGFGKPMLGTLGYFRDIPVLALHE